MCCVACNVRPLLACDDVRCNVTNTKIMEKEMDSFLEMRKVQIGEIELQEVSN